MKVSDYIAKWLKLNNIDTVFGYQGSSITHIIDSVVLQGINFVQNYHEQASAFCANAYAHVSGNFGVAVSCSGPGATNLITGIANAYYDSIPCLFITGQVSVNELKKDSLLRQNGFQETDIVSMVSSITKYAVTVTEPEKIRYYLEKSLYLLKSGRQGPVLLDIPHNIQKTLIEEGVLVSFFETAEYAAFIKNDSEIDCKKIGLVSQLIAKSQRPLFLFGGGMRKLKDTPLLERFIGQLNIPVVVSLRGLDSIDHSNSNYYGFIGLYGNRYANIALAYSDLVVVLGSRLDSRQTGGMEFFALNAKIIQVDIDEAELNKASNRVVSIKGSCEKFILNLYKEICVNNFNFQQWHQQLARLKASYPSGQELKGQDGINPNIFLETLFKKVTNSCIVATDVGQHQMWVAQSIFLRQKSYFLVSGGHGAMGYSLPAIIGAAYVCPAKPLLCIVGDGGFQMNLQELETIVRDGLNIKIFIMNNRSLGLIRDYQNKVLEGRCFGSVQGFSVPNLEKIAKAYGLTYIKIQKESDFEKTNIILYRKKAAIIEVIISRNSKIAPEPTYMKPLIEQSPTINKSELDLIFDGGEYDE